VTFWLAPALFFVNALLMNSSVRTDESHENARLENAQKIQEKRKAQARRDVTGLNVLGVGRWEFGKSSCHSNHTQNNGFIMRLPTLKEERIYPDVWNTRIWVLFRKQSAVVTLIMQMARQQW
jgi:hypothetical protein